MQTYVANIYRSEIPSSYQLIKNQPRCRWWCCICHSTNCQTTDEFCAILFAFILFGCLFVVGIPYIVLFVVIRYNFAWRLAFARHFYCYTRGHSPFGCRIYNTLCVVVHKQGTSGDVGAETCAVCWISHWLRHQKSFSVSPQNIPIWIQCSCNGSRHTMPLNNKQPKLIFAKRSTIPFVLFLFINEIKEN